jgi:dTDP-4-dehydrorhamnose reductase
MKKPRIKVLVTGAGGQLGRELTGWTDPQFEIHGFGRESLDVTDLQQCRDVMSSMKPDAIIHCAAYTAVDKAESEPEEAFRINETGTRNLAIAAHENRSKLCYISTDYVFDGTSLTPYRESDQTNPLTMYGKSKLAGEQVVQLLLERYFIVRTSWVYGKYGSNFVKTMLKLSEERDEVKVVHDQIGSPTYAQDLARFLLELIQTDRYGIYHASNTGACSWYDFAKAIFEENGKKIQVVACTTAEFPRPASRPAYSVMEHEAIRTNGLQDLPPWREALRHFLKEI